MVGGVKLDIIFVILDFCRLLSKNAVASDKSKVVLLTDDSARFGEAWAEPTTCQEIIDGVLNFVALIQATRGYSYEAIALLRSLHFRINIVLI